MGHGGLLFLFCLYLTLFNGSIEKDKNHSINALLPLRHFLLMCGFFATFCGFVYNYYLAMSLNLQGSCYKITGNEEKGDSIDKEVDCNYAFGLDSVWKNSTNEPAFVNSFKMKLSVILGIVQMMFGIILKGVNVIHFKSKIDFIFEFIPQCIFMLNIVASMDFMIFFKQGTDWSNDTGNAPMIINIMTNFLIKGGAVCEEKTDG